MKMMQNQLCLNFLMKQFSFIKKLSHIYLNNIKIGILAAYLYTYFILIKIQRF